MVRPRIRYTLSKKNSISNIDTEIVLESFDSETLRYSRRNDICNSNIFSSVSLVYSCYASQNVEIETGTW